MSMFQRNDQAEGGYSINHPGLLYIRGRKGRLIGALGHDAGIGNVVQVAWAHLWVDLWLTQADATLRSFER